MLYRVELPSNTVAPLAHFGGILQIELPSSSVPTNTSLVLKSSCIQSTTCFPLNRASLSMVILDYRFRTDSVLLIC